MLCYLSVYYIVGRNKILTTYKFKCRLDKLDFEGHNISLVFQVSLISSAVTTSAGLHNMSYIRQQMFSYFVLYRREP